MATVEAGERFPAKYGRTGFRRNLVFDATWHGTAFGTKQVEAYCAAEGEDWVVITVIVRYFGAR